MKGEIKIPSWLASLFVSSLLGLEAWTLKEISSLKERVAGLSVKIEMMAGQKQNLAARPQPKQTASSSYE